MAINNKYIILIFETNRMTLKCEKNRINMKTCFRRHLPGKEETAVGQVEPRYTWTGHALPVTGGHVSPGPAHGARVVTCSLDMTVKVGHQYNNLPKLNGHRLGWPMVLETDYRNYFQLLLSKI